MKILFLDDCFRRDKNIFGNGGFAIDEKYVKLFCDDIAAIKKKYAIPYHIEIKWSPDQKHYLNITFKGNREHLFRDILGLLHTYNAKIICAAHNLNHCYGIKNGWGLRETQLWATKNQYKYIAERFEKPVLKDIPEYGLIISDQYSDHKGRLSLLNEIHQSRITGTAYHKFSKICLNPIMVDSNYYPPIQVADLIIGIIVGALSENPIAQGYIEMLYSLFLMNPHEGAIAFSSTVSASILGYGLILFPTVFRTYCRKIFVDIDNNYIHNESGVSIRSKSIF